MAAENRERRGQRQRDPRPLLRELVRLPSPDGASYGWEPVRGESLELALQAEARGWAVVRRAPSGVQWASLTDAGAAEAMRP
jgi:hypothetical protein